MNFKQTLIFCKHKIEKKKRKFEFFLYVFNNTLLLEKKIEHQRNCIIKIKVPFVKIISLNETI